MNLQEASNGPAFDVTVIGGGINGAAIAAECARRGLRTALLEKHDFGFGTTWRSTKLIHGGLRYLEHGDLRLVFESLHERAWLLRAKPHLVAPQRFVLPMLPWTRRPGWQMRAGLTTYDLLALGGGLPHGQRLSEDAVAAALPFLTPLASDGFAYFDARALSPERLTLELALLAKSRGAFVANHTRVNKIEVENGRISAVRVASPGQFATLATNAVVNAAGPWVDAVNSLLPMTPPPRLWITRGTHIAVELDGPLPADAIISTAREDGRVFFAVPQDELLLVGTTDIHFDGYPGDVRPTPEDVDYLLREAQALLPGLELSRDSIRYSYAGLRPLQYIPGKPESAITRRHALIDHHDEGGPAGMFSVIGGKLSTFRPLARETARTLAKGMPIELAVPGKRRIIPAPTGSVPAPASPRQRLYGPAWAKIAARDAAPICSECGMLRGEVLHAMESELALSLSDVVLRRTGTGWRANRGTCCAETISKVMAEQHGWDEEVRLADVEAFEADLRFHLPAMHEIAGVRT